MNGLGIGLIVAGGFLFGIGMSHTVPFAGMLSVAGVILIAAGLVAFFALGRKQKKHVN